MEITKEKEVEILEKIQNGVYESFVNFTCGLESNKKMMKIYLKDKKKNSEKIVMADRLIESRKSQLEELEIFDEIIKEKLSKLKSS